MSAKIFNRYVWLLDLVARHDGITYNNISRAWEHSALNDLRGTGLPRRTFNNHIAAIKEMFDISIVCQRYGDYKYVLQSTDGGKLSETQLQLLQQIRLSNALTTKPILNKRIILDKSMVYRHINPLLAAMEESRVIKLKYRRACEEGITRIEYIFEPYFIKQFSRDWYVVGRSVEENTIRIFSFRNCGEIEQLEKTFTYPEEFDTATFMDSIVESKREGECAKDDRDLFTAERIDDRRIHRSIFGSLVPDEVIE